MASTPIRFRLLRELLGLSVLIPAVVIMVWTGLARLVRTEASDPPQEQTVTKEATVTEIPVR